RWLLEFVALRARSKECHELEIIALRHELAILRRTTRRAAITAADRMMLAVASRFLPRARWQSFIVTPATFRIEVVFIKLIPLCWRWSLASRALRRDRHACCCTNPSTEVYWRRLHMSAPTVRSPQITEIRSRVPVETPVTPKRTRSRLASTEAHV